MAQPAIISREQAARQQAEIKPPSATPEVPEAPKRAAPGSHPAAPLESDAEALAAAQGKDQIEARQATHGSWQLNAFNQPVFRAKYARGGPGGRRGEGRSLTEPAEEPVEPPGQRAEKRAQEEATSPMEGRREAEKPGSPREAGQRGR